MSAWDLQWGPEKLEQFAHVALFGMKREPALNRIQVQQNKDNINEKEGPECQKGQQGRIPLSLMFQQFTKTIQEGTLMSEVRKDIQCTCSF